MKACAVAHPNIAVVKYWGKRDEDLILPANSSLSMTVDGLSATTTVEFGGREADSATVDGRACEGEDLARIVRVLDAVRAKAGRAERARVVSRTDFPKSVGLASSSAGFAALAAAASWAAGQSPTAAELSILARLGSGSACRSIEGGFCEWRRGEAADGSDSYAVQVAPPDHWPDLRMVVVVVSSEPKAVSSREGMRRCVETSPYFEAWTKVAAADVPPARQAVLDRDLPALGRVAERNAYRMHACALAADPPIQYMEPGTVAVIAAALTMRAGGAPVYFTLDAGPNPVLLVEASLVSRLEIRLGGMPGVQRILVGGPGQGVRPAEKHLF